MTKHFAGLMIFVLMALVSGCHAPQRGADLVLTDANIISLAEPDKSFGAIVVRDGRIAYIGGKSEAMQMTDADTVIRNLNGSTIVPGLVDAHCHLLGLGMALENVDLTGTLSYGDVIQRVKERAARTEPGTWIRGRGWDQNDWEDSAFPTHEALSAAVPDHPVWLTRIDGHAGLANELAMRWSSVTKETPDPAGGKINRNPDGFPTGVFVDNAEALIADNIPPLTAPDRQRMLARAATACLAVGLTGVHDMGMQPEQIADYKALIDRHELGLRVYAMLEAPDPGTDLVTHFRKHRVDGYMNDLLTVRGVKLYMDGALGSRGAALLEPYADDPGNTGLIVMSESDAVAICRAALAADFQVCTHAIGDNGNRLILDVYETALGDYPRQDHRFRVEHAQILSPLDIPRFSRLNVIPSMQPTHATSDMPWAEKRLGSTRIAGAYAWRSLLDSGVIIPCGSDFPIESHNPMLGIFAAVARTDRTGNPAGGWRPEQRMTRMEALKGFTGWAAHASFREDALGAIAVGKLADLTVLDGNPLTCPVDAIDDIRAIMTIVGGEIRYEGAVHE